MLLARKRQPKRPRVLLPALLRSGDLLLEVRMCDVSSGGACLESDPAPDSGRAFRLEREGMDVACTVSWRRGKRFGIEWCAPLDPALLEQLVGDGLRVAAARVAVE